MVNLNLRMNNILKRQPVFSKEDRYSKTESPINKTFPFQKLQIHCIISNFGELFLQPYYFQPFLFPCFCIDYVFE